MEECRFILSEVGGGHLHDVSRTGEACLGMTDGAATLSLLGAKQISLIGASDAGLYFKESYDCGCNAGLQLTVGLGPAHR